MSEHSSKLFITSGALSLIFFINIKIMADLKCSWNLKDEIFFVFTSGFYSFTALFLNVKWHTFERQDCRSGSGLDQVILEGWIQILLTWSGSAALQCERCVNPESAVMMQRVHYSTLLLVFYSPHYRYSTNTFLGPTPTPTLTPSKGITLYTKII